MKANLSWSRYLYFSLLFFFSFVLEFLSVFGISRA